MNKRWLIVGVIVMAGALLARCGGGDDEKSPDTAKASFTNPDGTITSDNATDVMNQALDSSAGNGQAVEGLPFAKLGRLNAGLNAIKQRIRSQEENPYGECFTDYNEDGVTVNVDCWARNDGFGEECTGGAGSIFVGFTDDLFTFQFIDFSLTCDPPAEFEVCDATFLWEAENKEIVEDGVFCSDVTCTVEGETESFAGCFLGDDILLETEDGDVVALNIDTNDDCTKVCAEFDVAGETNVAVSCDVPEADAGCSDWTEISEVSSCELSEGLCDL